MKTQVATLRNTAKLKSAVRVANADIDGRLAYWLQCLLYAALILVSNMALGVFTLARAGDMAPLTSVDQNSPLKDIMKQVGDDFKAIDKTVADPAQTAADAARASELVDLFTLALQRVPDTISKMPAADQPKATQSYKDQMTAMVALTQKLLAALQAKDTTAAAGIVSQMKDGRKQGHDDFKPKDDDQ